MTPSPESALILEPIFVSGLRVLVGRWAEDTKSEEDTAVQARSWCQHTKVKAHQEDSADWEGNLWDWKEKGHDGKGTDSVRRYRHCVGSRFRQQRSSLAVPRLKI